jgi:3-methyl-2-oxobutanoate hydroxymethyltransferase
VAVILVGDSLGMVIQGQTTTLPVTLDEMAYHTAAVARGSKNAFILADMPFLSHVTPHDAVLAAGRLMQAGAHGVKLEGGRWLAPIIEMLANHGIPVCAHLGLRPQSVYKLGGYRVQGRESADAQSIRDEAALLVAAGADLLLLECVPAPLAATISAEVAVPVIGIGAGSATDGQVLVLYDMLGITRGRSPRFVRNFMADGGTIAAAVAAYVAAVESRQFPAALHAFE